MKTASRIKLAATVATLVRASTRPGAPGVGERVQAVPRLVRATLDHTYAGTSLRRLGLVAAAVAYVASPIDLVPEAILPVVGALDDAVVLTWVVRAFFEETDRFIAWEIGRGVRQASAVSTGPHVPAAPPAPRPSSPSSPPAASDAGAAGRVGLPEGARQAATDYVLESVRKRLER
ncbi:YkvA family protein [Intrasporangium flavum]|uniref:YkvA family protein n=1 Tax=Intrasporangium flavum TaxID=1428657 RepID=UPI00096D80CA|nr:YkvA family protein [Intrasporangium flavum]